MQPPLHLSNYGRMKQVRDGLIFVLVVGGLVAVGMGFRYELSWLFATGWLLAGIGAGLGLHDCVRKGVLRGNFGTIRREDGPGWFRFQAILWSLAVAAWTIGGVLVALGVIGKR